MPYILLFYGAKVKYSNQMASKYEPMHLDILGMQLDRELSVQKNITEIENQLYMLTGEI